MLGVGIDGCRAGWAVVILSEARGRCQILHREVLGCFSELPDCLRRGGAPMTATVLVDMPIGLPDSGLREVEPLARRRPGVRSASIFNVPPRAVLEAASYDEAKAVSQAASGRKLSLQSWYIVPRIRDLDAYLQRREGSDPQPRESHPELVWAALAGACGAALPLAPKRSAPGRAQRCALLERFGLDSTGLLEQPFLGPRPTPAADDRLDAAVLALLASWPSRCRDSIPQATTYDALGLPMEMVVPHPARSWLQPQRPSD